LRRQLTRLADGHKGFLTRMGAGQIDVACPGRQLLLKILLAAAEALHLAADLVRSHDALAHQADAIAALLRQVQIETAAQAALEQILWSKRLAIRAGDFQPVQAQGVGVETKDRKSVV